MGKSLAKNLHPEPLSRYSLIVNSKGMHTVLVRYFETLRNTLSQYQQISENSTLIAALYNSKDLEELCEWEF